MNKMTEFRENSDAVQAHLQIAQSVIGRMATNSASCKAWCIALVSAIIVVVADKGQPRYAAVAAIPTVLFLALDTYYLGLERRFRNSYNAFIDKLHQGRVGANDLYHIEPTGSSVEHFFRSILSFSIWPFYLTLGAMIVIAQQIMLK